MHYLRLVSLILASMLFTSCASVKPVTHIKAEESDLTIGQRQLLLGSWQGEAPVKGGGSRTWIVHRYIDGTYQIDFTLTDASGSISKHSEAGIWGTSAGFYFTATRGFVEPTGFSEADTTDPAFYDVYQIIALTQDAFEYQNMSTGNRYVVKRLLDSPSAP